MNSVTLTTRQKDMFNMLSEGFVLLGPSASIMLTFSLYTKGYLESRYNLQEIEDDKEYREAMDSLQAEHFNDMFESFCLIMIQMVPAYCEEKDNKNNSKIIDDIMKDAGIKGFEC